MKFDAEERTGDPREEFENRFAVWLRFDDTVGSLTDPRWGVPDAMCIWGYRQTTRERSLR